ncbi:hypothetical protein DB35_02840 [Streptomyces abyssalis]|uniref:DUF881 domain-containing protein n=1 Tax=Streptomyces abyssalis TaxID=933944 RepID=A0A1E7JPS5_9ACTN|nr:DUF881 domain-containing protein [Streptomyces abyssalis]OEU90240.1 hypothetical protein AN215_11980 [Streptomyces abyssalis]OEU94974.1 hypothetical protein DB35_02840 [Streptomyces abyssalis]OEV29690.1 hypothetical protein AN219_15130 [Streptomyces nanshensis]
MTRFRIRPARLATLGVFALAGLIFWISFNTAHGTDLRTDSSMLRLSDLIQERSRKNAELDSSAAAVRSQVDRLAQRDSGSSSEENRKLSGLEKDAGTKKVSGAGLSVTLDDAPPDATAQIPGVPEPQANDLVIHQQDLQAVVNALWKGGAEGIKIMDQRLISTSAVRCVGNTLILQGRVYSPPYQVTAVGDQESLQKALNASPAIQNYLQYVDAYDLGWKVDERKSVTLPGYSGTVDLQYAKPTG